MMRLAAKRRAAWSISSCLAEGTQSQVRVNGEWIEVAKLGAGDPIVMIPGMAGGWRLVAPLAERLARRYEVHVCGLRGDRFPMAGAWATEVADHARDVAEVIGLLGLERPAVLGVSFGGAHGVNSPSSSLTRSAA
ncbi:MAG: alpha/beta fold hydrolase [Isosphaeraceae bacterium]